MVLRKYSKSLFQSVLLLIFLIVILYVTLLVYIDKQQMKHSLIFILNNDLIINKPICCTYFRLCCDNVEYFYFSIVGKSEEDIFLPIHDSYRKFELYLGSE